MYASATLRQIIAPMFTEHTLNMQGAQQVKDLLTVPVILGTGATPLTPRIPGIDGQNVVVAEDVLLGKSAVKPGSVVVSVIGGAVKACNALPAIAEGYKAALSL